MLAEKANVNIAVSEPMTNAIKLWSDCYADIAPWISSEKYVSSMNLFSAVSKEMARLVTLEFKSEITGGKRAEYLMTFYNKLIDDSTTFTEYACAKGGLMFKPYITQGGIATAYVQADSFFPTAFDSNNNITGCVFVEQLIRGKTYYTRLETHDFSQTKYTIKNNAYTSDNINDLGRAIPISSVPEWADLQEETIVTNAKRPLYAYFKMPGANRIDNGSPLGVSIFANAVNAIHDADVQYSRLKWEFEGSELAVHMDYTALRNDSTDSGMIMPKLNERLYRGLDMTTDKLIDVFSPAIREQSLLNGLDSFIRNAEFLSGLAYGTLSKMEENSKTATEIKTSKQRSYSTVSAIQKSLENALTDYLECLDILCDLYKLAPSDKTEQSFEWDDSLVTDMETDQKIWLQEVASGLMSPAEYRMRRYGETEEQAKEMLPEVFEDGEV